jgi:hypothetical protein
VFFSGDCERRGAVGRPAKQGFAHMGVWAATRQVASGACGLLPSRQTGFTMRAFAIAPREVRVVRTEGRLRSSAEVGGRRASFGE